MREKNRRTKAAADHYVYCVLRCGETENRVPPPNEMPICFQNQFLTSGSGQTKYPQIRVFADFLFDHFPKLKIDSKSRFEMRNAIFLYYFFFGRALVDI